MDIKIMFNVTRCHNCLLLFLRIAAYTVIMPQSIAVQYIKLTKFSIIDFRSQLYKIHLFTFLKHLFFPEHSYFGILSIV